jgi:hypothetical protein
MSKTGIIIVPLKRPEEAGKALVWSMTHKYHSEMHVVAMLWVSFSYSPFPFPGP